MTDTAGREKARLAGPPPCSARARLAAEPLAATASFGRRWLLLEVAGAWGPSAFRQSPAVDPALGARIERQAAAGGFRLAAIRRPGRARHASGPQHRWARVDTTPGGESIVWGEAAEPAAYLTDPFTQPGTPAAGNLIAVCAHGRHDQCCATRGRAVAAELWRDDPAAVWECSHIGGDRFAATMLLFPHGINYGWADTLGARAMVREYQAGRVLLPGLRGRCSFTFLEQAAQDAARRAYGDLRIDAYQPVQTARTGPRSWEVHLADPAGPVRVELEETMSAPLYSNCAATVAVARPVFAVRGVSRQAAR
ncbi:MAG TPA: sucrase ferredoxin [Trebonia sp.]